MCQGRTRKCVGSRARASSSLMFGMPVPGVRQPYLLGLTSPIAGVRFQRRYVVDDSPAVARHQLDHDAAEAALGWEPSVGIAEGIRKTYEWVRDQIDSSPARA